MTIDTALLFSFIEVESSFNAKAFRPDRNGGSYGLMQLDMPTAQDRGYAGANAGLYQPRINIQYGIAVLDWIVTELEKRGMYSIANVAAAFNAGLEHVISGGTDATYSGKIEAAYSAWRTILGESA
jgi:soluble lytic murein transglycosylase-like protein